MQELMSHQLALRAAEQPTQHVESGRGLTPPRDCGTLSNQSRHLCGRRSNAVERGCVQLIQQQVVHLKSSTPHHLSISYPIFW